MERKGKSINCIDLSGIILLQRSHSNRWRPTGRPFLFYGHLTLAATLHGFKPVAAAHQIPQPGKGSFHLGPPRPLGDWGGPFHSITCLSTCTLAASAAVAPLALGLTVPAASGLLIPVPGRAQRFASGEAATARSAILLPTVATRAEPHLTLTPGAQKQSGIVHRSPRRGGLDDPTSPGNTGLGAVCKCGSGRSLGRDRQVNALRGCVGLFAESDLTPTPGRRHRGCARRQRPLISNIGSGGKQRHNSRGTAGTTQSTFALFRPIRLRRAVRRIRAHLRSHQQPLHLQKI